jgi:hypothetical protein
MDHERPLFTVMKVGGDRVRTIAEEDLNAAQALQRPASEPLSGPRCGACGSRQYVAGELSPRRTGCRAHERTARAATKAAMPTKKLRSRSRLCEDCPTELPLSGVCGFCD